MNTKLKIYMVSVFISIAFVISGVSFAFGETYESLKGVESVKAVFDVRLSNPKVAAVHLDLLHKTFNDSAMTINSKKPELVVIFMGPAVKLVSKAREGYTPEEQKQLDEIAGIISKMAKDGIKLEICLAAVHLTGGDPALILPEIKQVGNGWISAIGYQLKGYALISDF
jgi:intracellular sulfur oxidation DsrE/DsrF family protein